MKREKRELEEAVYEIDFNYESQFSMLNDAIFTDKTGIPFVGLNAVHDEVGAVTTWTIKIEQGKKMGEVMDRIPFGLLNKTITGLGATTLELMNQERNSIIVVPTKSLAYNKYKTANQIKNDDYAFYVGSPIKDILSSPSQRQLRNYLNNSTGLKKKFLVVADSLPKVINAIQENGIDVYNDYFLMVDEIDTLQSDSVFRPKLEIVMDYYFNFNRRKRAAVTATLNDFTNPSINLESKVNTIWENKPRRDITLIDTNSVDDIATDKIRNIYNSSSDKILIAYNSLDGILNIIAKLGQIIKDESGILCSERSFEKVSEYIDDNDGVIDENGRLQKRITFMTCAYFAGIDIFDRCHLISISSHLQPFTYLSLNRLEQIAGRCRNGNLSEYIIYDIPRMKQEPSQSAEEYSNQLLNKSRLFCNFLNDTRKLVLENPDLYPIKEFIDSFVDYNSYQKAGNNISTKIVRQNSLTYEFVPAYFNIDALLERYQLVHSLYTHKENLYNELVISNKVTWNEHCYLSEESLEYQHITEIKARNKERLAEKIESAKVTLREWIIQPDYEVLDGYCSNTDRSLSNFFKAFSLYNS